VAFIDDELQKSSLSRKCFASRKMIGIAQTMPRITSGGVIELLPCYVDNNGNIEYVGPEDYEDLIIYHRVNSIVNGKANLPSFGDIHQTDAHIASMSMVVFGRRDHLKLSNDELSIIIQAGMPEAATRQLIQAMNFMACNINVKDIILNDLLVFREEYENIVYFLKPEQFLFKVNYTIESAFLKKCFINCN